jgi:dienelactone hydrolase
MRLIAILLLLAGTAPAADRPRLFGRLEPGRYAIGFRVLEAKSIPGSVGWEPRPIEIAMWYPAIASSGPRLTFGDYFQMSGDLRRRSTADGSDGSGLTTTLSTAVTGDPSHLGAARVKEILDLPMLGQRDLRPAQNRFPVVLWSARYGTTAAQAVLSEYLASHGYVVAFARPAKDREVLPFEAKDAMGKLEELDAQVADMRGALQAVRGQLVADLDRSAILAWSYSGESATRLQASDARIDAVIALSTNALSQWVYQDEGALAALDGGFLRVPFVVLTEKSGVQRPASWPHLPHGSAFVQIPDVSHGNFNTIEGMLPAVMGIDRVPRWSRGGPPAQRGYEMTAEIVRAALDETFGRRRALDSVLRSMARSGVVAERVVKPVRAEPFRTVEIVASDGMIVTADHYRAARGSRAPCILMLHQSGSSRGEFRSIAPRLVALGHPVLAMDVRWGQRDRWNDVVNETAERAGTAEARDANDRRRIDAIREGSKKDIEAALQWMRDAGCSGPVLAWGSSIHANAVLRLVADRPQEIGGVVDFSPGEYGADKTEMQRVAARIRRPALILWGRTEEELSRPIAEAIAPEFRRTFASRRGRHGTAILFEDPKAWEAIRTYLGAVASFR